MEHHGLILDFDGVVTTDLFAELSAFCLREGLASDAFLHVLRDVPEGREVFHAVEAGKIPQREYEITIGRLLGVDDRGLLRRALGGLRPRPEVLNLVSRARSGVRVGVLSNSWGEGDYDPYDGWDLDAMFDAVVISGDVGIRKPDREIYLIAAGKLGVPPSECVFADDTASNLPAARDLGMAVVHFTEATSGISEIEGLLNMTRRQETELAEGPDRG